MDRSFGGQRFERAAHYLLHGRVRPQFFGQHLHLKIVVGDNAGRIGEHQGGIYPGPAHGFGRVGHAGGRTNRNRRPHNQVFDWGGQFAANGRVFRLSGVAQPRAQIFEKKLGKLLVMSELVKNPVRDTENDTFFLCHHIKVGRALVDH